jgi:AraC-like DNA-binding protein
MATAGNRRPSKAMQTKDPAPVAGFAIRGAVHLANDPPGTVTSLESLASRFVLEEQGPTTKPIARPASAVGLSMETGGLESEPHAHPESQLVYLVRGELICEASNAIWIVPPRSALWIPGSVTHRIRAKAPLEGYSLLVDPGAAPGLPRDCCAVSTTPLLRELLLRLATRPPLYDAEGPEARLVSVILDELSRVVVENHRLPMPNDARLRLLVDAMIANPASGATMKTWAKRIGVGERTLNRLLVAETGLSFGRWQRQLHVILAIQKMSRGATVQRVALDLGYESASSFVTMFRKALGTSPARHMAGRLTSSG